MFASPVARTHDGVDLVHEDGARGVVPRQLHVHSPTNRVENTPVSRGWLALVQRRAGTLRVRLGLSAKFQGLHNLGKRPLPLERVNEPSSALND